MHDSLKGWISACDVCGAHLFEIVTDKKRGEIAEPSDVKAIHPQTQPNSGDKMICSHCGAYYRLGAKLVKPNETSNIHLTWI